MYYNWSGIIRRKRTDDREFEDCMIRKIDEEGRNDKGRNNSKRNRRGTRNKR